jgi:hypothetical protein
MCTASTIGEIIIVSISKGIQRGLVLAAVGCPHLPDQRDGGCRGGRNAATLEL